MELLNKIPIFEETIKNKLNIMKFNFKKIWQSALAGMVSIAIIAGVLGAFGSEMPGLLTLLLIGGAGAGAFFIFRNNNWWI